MRPPWLMPDEPASPAQLSSRATPQMSWRDSALRSARSMHFTSATVAKECKVEGVGLRLAMARKQASFKLYARNAEGTGMAAGGDPFSIALRGASIVRPTVQDHEDGS